MAITLLFSPEKKQNRVYFNHFHPHILVPSPPVGDVPVWWCGLRQKHALARR